MENKAPVIHELFAPLFRDDLDAPRYYQVYGGRGSMKSYTTSLAIIGKTYSSYGHKILYLRQTMVSIEDSSMTDLKTAIEVLNKGNDFKTTGNTITNLLTGSTIVFKGMNTSGQNTAKLKSLSGITILVIEEAEEVESLKEFEKVDFSIRTLGKPLSIILIYNPTSAITSWIHEEWFIDGQPNPDRFVDTCFIHSTYLDNPHLNPSTIRSFEAKKLRDPVDYRNTILAEWTLELSGQVYGGWGRYDYFEDMDNPKGITWYGMDFAYGGKDSTACVKITYFDEMYYVEEVFCKQNMNVRDILKELRKKGVPFDAKIYADYAMPLLINGIHEGGYRGIENCTKGLLKSELKSLGDKDITVVGDMKCNIFASYILFRYDSKDKLPHEPDILASIRYGINSMPANRLKVRKDIKRKFRQLNRTSGVSEYL